MIRAPLVVAVLLLAACSGGVGDRADRGSGAAVQAAGQPGAQTATVVSNDRLEFDPGVVEAAVGTLTLTHRNAGAVPHNLVFEEEALGAIDTVTGGQEKSIRLTLDTPGTYDFRCTFHSGQDGRVVVS